MKDQEQQQQSQPQRAAAPSGGAVYGLGLVGAMIWFWQHSEGTKGHTLAVLKAFVWPTFLVYNALRRLND